MTGVVVKRNEEQTGVKIGLDTGTAPAIPVDSTFTIRYYGSISTSDDCVEKDSKEQEVKAKKERAERERVKKMREGWKMIRKGHGYQR
jgi:hypothetical protein